MGKIVRFVLLGVVVLGVFAAFVAMFAEPFAAELYKQLGIDTSRWVTPMLTFLSQDWVAQTLLVLMGAAAGAWLHWLATKWDARKAGKAVQPRPQSVTRWWGQIDQIHFASLDVPRGVNNRIVLRARIYNTGDRQSALRGLSVYLVYPDRKVEVSPLILSDYNDFVMTDGTVIRMGKEESLFSKMSAAIAPGAMISGHVEGCFQTSPTIKPRIFSKCR